MPVSSARSNNRTSNRNQMSRRYRIAAIMHWSVILPLILASTLAFLSVALAIGVAVLGELGLLSVLPRLGAFRRRVDARHERRVAAELRASMLARMSASHRGALEGIERLADGIRKRCGRGGEGPAVDSDAAVERWLRARQAPGGLRPARRRPHQSGGGISCGARRRPGRGDRKDGRAFPPARRKLDACLERRRAVLHRRRETWIQAATSAASSCRSSPRSSTSFTGCTSSAPWLRASRCATESSARSRRGSERRRAAGGVDVVSRRRRARRPFALGARAGRARKESGTARRVDAYTVKTLEAVPVGRAVPPVAPPQPASATAALG